MGLQGSAFLWYAEGAQAHAAIVQFHMQHLLPDPTKPGRRSNPLVVKVARPPIATVQDGMAIARPLARSWPDQNGNYIPNQLVRAINDIMGYQ